jgi:hypothetical protein
MKKSYFTIVLTLACVLGLGITAHAQEARRVVAKVQFDFVVDGSRTMHAGTYSITRISQDPHSGLIISNDNDSAILLPMAIGDTSAQTSGLRFEHVGDRYFLSKVEMPMGIYTMAIPRAITELARNRDHGTVSFAGN